MITHNQWDKLTPQQQWDHYCLLWSECGDSPDDEDTHKFTDDELTEILQQPSTGD